MQNGPVRTAVVVPVGQGHTRRAQHTGREVGDLHPRVARPGLVKDRGCRRQLRRRQVMPRIPHPHGQQGAGGLGTADHQDRMLECGVRASVAGAEGREDGERFGGWIVEPHARVLAVGAQHGQRQQPLCAAVRAVSPRQDRVPQGAEVTRLVQCRIGQLVRVGDHVLLAPATTPKEEEHRVTKRPVQRNGQLPKKSSRVPFFVGTRSVQLLRLAHLAPQLSDVVYSKARPCRPFDW